MIAEDIPIAAGRQKPWIAAVATAFRTHSGLVLDLTERTILVGMFLPFAYRFYCVATNNFQPLLMGVTISELLPIVMILTRRYSPIVSRNPSDWVLAVVGSNAPLLALPAIAAPLASPYFCVALWLSGMLLQISAKLALGRSFGIVAANRGVRVIGPYRLIRHPMYAGYTLTHVSILLTCPSLVNAAIYAAAFLVQVARLTREECVLTGDPEYRRYAELVRYKLVPGVF